MMKLQLSAFCARMNDHNLKSHAKALSQNGLDMALACGCRGWMASHAVSLVKKIDFSGEALLNFKND